MRLPLRRIVFGFVLGAAGGWLVSLLRTPATAPAGSSADEAMRLPQEDFGEPAAPVEPEPEVAAEPPKKPAPRKRAPRKAATPDPTAAATETLRAAAAEATERLDVAAAEAAPEPEPPTPASRRRRRPTAE